MAPLKKHGNSINPPITSQNIMNMLSFLFKDQSLYMNDVGRTRIVDMLPIATL